MKHWIILQSVVETCEFVKQASDCMDDEMRNDFIAFIAENPLAGDIIQGTGGLRKIRWQSDAYTGKRGGVRVIYYYHDDEIPIFLFTVYKKNQKDSISLAEKKELKKILRTIVSIYKGNEDEQKRRKHIERCKRGT